MRFEQEQPGEEFPMDRSGRPIRADEGRTPQIQPPRGVRPAEVTSIESHTPYRMPFPDARGMYDDGP